MKTTSFCVISYISFVVAANELYYFHSYPISVVTQPDVAVALIKSVVDKMRSGMTQKAALQACNTNRNTVHDSKFIYYMDAINPGLLQEVGIYTNESFL